MDWLPQLRTSTARVVDTAWRLTETQAREPSALPDWSRAAVLTHLARSADALGRLVVGATTGVAATGYDSPQARDAEIAAGALRPPGEIAADLADAAERLQDALDALSPAAREASVTVGRRTVPGSELPLLRLREVEIHSVDLRLGHTPAQWPPAFVAALLDDLAPVLAGRGTPVTALEGVGVDGAPSGRRWTLGSSGPVVRGTEHDLLAWVTGREPTGRLIVEPPGPLPATPDWS